MNRVAVLIALLLFLFLLVHFNGCKSTEETAVQYEELPKLLDYTPPVYPEHFLLGIEDASVVLRLRIDAFGNVRAASVVKSSGDSALDTSALKAVQNWRYSPARSGGKAVPIAIEQQVRFSLQVQDVLTFYEIVVSRGELADSLWSLLDRGEDFMQLAKQFSEARSAAKGGLREMVRYDAIPPSIRLALDRLGPGQFGLPFKRSDGKFVILKRKKA